MALSQWMEHGLCLYSWLPGREAASLAAGRANEVVCIHQEHGFSAEEPWEAYRERLASLQVTPVRLGCQGEFACGLIFSIKLMKGDSQPA